MGQREASDPAGCINCRANFGQCEKGIGTFFDQAIMVATPNSDMTVSSPCRSRDRDEKSKYQWRHAMFPSLSFGW